MYKGAYGKYRGWQVNAGGVTNVLIGIWLKEECMVCDLLLSDYVTQKGCGEEGLDLLHHTPTPW